MAIGEVIILFTVLLTQTLSAPSGCIESCNFYQQTSYQNRQTGGYQDHAALVQGSTNLNEHDYARPGNWTERNQYNTDGGRGKVHEERGQYLDGSKRIRYYKKNFTSGYGTVDGLTDLSGQSRYDSLHIPSSQIQHLESQVGAHELGQTITKESEYSRVHSQQSSMRIGGKSERLEDFGEYGGHSQHGVNVQTIETATPQNWNRVDSYRTDGGRGQVFEEEGQYVTGPKQGHYYRKNYTSSYSASSDTAGALANLNQLHNELQRNVQEELDKFRQEFHHQTTGLTQEAVHSFHGNDLQTAESENTYRHQQLSGYHRVYPSTGTVRHHTDQQQQTETFADTGTQQSVHPIANTHGQTESQRTYQSHETYVSRAHPVPQPSPHLSPSYPVQVTGGNYQTAQSYSHSGGHRHVDEVQREISGAHQNRLFTERVYNPNPTYTSVYPGRRDETRHYQEEQWQSSSSHGGNLTPERSTDLAGSHGTGSSRINYDRDAYNEHRGRYHSSAQGYDSHVGSSYSSGYGISSGQKLVAPGSSLNLGQTAHSTHGADCTEETHQQYQRETSYHRKYKRDDRHVLQDQKFEPDSEKLDLTHASDQQVKDFMQHDEELTQQTEDQLEFGQQTDDDQYPHDFTQQSEQFAQESDHLAQQMSDKLNFGQQIVGDRRLEDLTQQNERFTQGTEGQLEFGQQTFSDQQHNRQFMQQESNDQTQQTGKLEFDQQIVGNQRLEDFTQQNEQKTEGQLEFGQQTFNDHHLTQNFMPQDYEDLTQQSAKLEFDHQTVGNQQAENLKQQTEQLETAGFDDYTQQVGKLEFGQQSVNDQHLIDSVNKPGNPKNQRLEEFNSEEFPQQERHDDFTQQTTGQLEFGSSNPKIDHHSQDFTQNEDLTQQMGGFGNFPPSEHLEWSREQSQKPNWPGYDTQHPEHYSQQNDWNADDLSQQSAQYPSYDNDNNKQAEWQVDMSQQTQQDFTHQQTDDDQQLARKPAPKPKPRPRYQQHDSTILSHTDEANANLDDIFEPIEVNPETDPSNFQVIPTQYSGRLTYPRSERHRSDIPSQNPRSTVFDNEKENMDRLHWVHKSNDATVGLQWHYTYHPSDLTNIEGSQNSYYPHHNINSQQQAEDDTQQQQQSRLFDFSQQKTEDQQTDLSEDTHVPQTSQVQRNQRDQQLGLFQQADTSHFGQFNQNSEQASFGVIPLQNQQQIANSQTTEQTEHNKMESRILEAYGGGPYDASRNDDIYRRVRPNPSATLPPLPGDEDPWDIREKPREMLIPWTVANSLPIASTSDNTATTTTEKTEITTQTMEGTTMEAPPSFWSRLGHKITRTYDKAKEKAKEYFG